MNDIKHPLDAVFNISDASNVDIEHDYEMAEIPPVPITTEPVEDVKDQDDILVEKRIDEVYDAAMEAFTNQSAYTTIIEPRYSARNAEVAANYLSIALQAAGTRAKVKTDRKRANQTFIPHGGGKNTTNVLVASREEIIRMITMDSEEKNL